MQLHLAPCFKWRTLLSLMLLFPEEIEIKCKCQSRSLLSRALTHSLTHSQCIAACQAALCQCMVPAPTNSPCTLGRVLLLNGDGNGCRSVCRRTGWLKNGHNLMQLSLVSLKSYIVQEKRKSFVNNGSIFLIRRTCVSSKVPCTR